MYLGINILTNFHMFQLAKVYFEEAAKAENFGADMDLFLCNKSLDENFDCLGQLQKILRKYESSDYRKITCLLHIALQYYNKEDYVNSAESFKQAIDLHIKSQQFKVNDEFISFFREYDWN